jgi:hypothetical protein
VSNGELRELCPQVQTPLDTVMGESIHMRSLTYDIAHDLQESGIGLLQNLGVSGMEPAA